MFFSNYNVINVLSVIAKHAAAKKEESSSDEDSSDDEVWRMQRRMLKSE